MEKASLIYNCKEKLVNVCNPNLNRKVGFTVHPVHANQGLKTYACEISIEVPQLNTTSAGSSTPLDQLNEKGASLLNSAAEEIEQQIEELIAHKDRLRAQAKMIEDGEIDIVKTAKQQQSLFWSEHQF
ncbi:hypothetical protein L1D14_07320 [Vibrio tubiashii]|uniref:hypothetical protein n=1 Tax=Vibrio tubiashii TaxID=29498 RepID=UPI001EFECFAF|nr:hypothetical protein [Vibrio tubiashii]MCG9576047.1 hypothetical protein [Vibrio tubiashii]